ncbi:sleepy-like protein Slp1 [Protomyces lactucae-debilis]|uniref:Sleepy-like protein Slp1 n=1 Tax=Protomyces lactucae-debilis TaxID=2754530 RepID=A0A1Y2F0E9_PROLT|nr:sleepy-like protein Slp1 [Protomyces lactucae-debilis]ORY76964.1 sleepy-like protein Slp1 [Protomyces lactucae-debilis]
MSLFTPQRQSTSLSSILAGPGSPLTPRNVNIARQLARQATPKSTLKRASPFKLDRVASDWTLTGTGTPNKHAKRQVKGHGAGDRFIGRANPATAKLNAEPRTAPATAYTDLAYSSQVAEACGIALNQRILAFKPEAPESKAPVLLNAQYNRPLRPVNTATVKRRINTVPERVLDAPGLIDDYYLNLLDWSSSNCVAIALEKSVYVWNAETGSVSSLLDCDASNYIASIKWAPDGSHLGVGLSDGTRSIYDAETGTRLRTLLGHDARVASMSWNNHLLTSGARNGQIHSSDVRIQQHHVASFNNHASEVCGLAWRADGQQLASGGNDNVVNIWDARSSIPKFTKTNHTAAVKALAWCPWNTSLLATGGGSSDRNIHFFSSTSGARLSTMNCTSQVTSLTWSPAHREIVSTHGFPDNQITVHSVQNNTLSKVVDIPAHDARVLHACLSPDGTTLATTSSDENLKFWKVFEAKRRTAEHERGAKEMRAGMTIR